MTRLHIAEGFTLPAEAVTQTFGILAVRGAGKSNAAVVMAEQMFKAGLHWVAIDPKGDWWGIRSNKEGTGPGLPVVIFGGRHADVPLESTSGQMIADLVVDQALTCILDTSEFTEGEKIRFLDAFGERLFRRKNDDQSPTMMFLEEADDYIPQRVMPKMAHLVNVFERLVKQGRARGLGATLISQRSAVVNKNVLTQVETLIVLRTTSPQDRDAIKGWVSYHGQRADILETLPSLENGEAWIWSPQWLGKVERIKFRQRETYDSGATPIALRKKRAPATLADVNLEQLRGRMAETIERAKQEDPRELRRKISELEKQLRNTKLAVDPEVERRLSLLESTHSATIAKVKFIVEMLRPLPERLSNALNELDQLWRDKGVPRAAAAAAGHAGPAGAIGRSTIPRPAPAPLAKFGEVRSNHHKPASAGPQRRILTVLAQRPEGVELDRLAILSGYTVSGHFNNTLGQLRSSGYVTPARVNPIQITEEGLKHLGAFDPLPTGEDLQTYWLERLSGPESRILKVLLDQQGAPIELEELAQRAGYTISGHFNNMVGSLRTKGLMTPPREPIRAAKDFFE